MESATKTRLEAGKQRSMSISDSAKLDMALASLKLDGSSEEKSDGVNVQELSGVFLKRVPIVESHAESNSTIPSYQYQLDNQRDYDVRVVMTFTGENIKCSPASGNFRQLSHHSVEGVIGKGRSHPFALVEAGDKSKNFSFSTDIKVYPVHDDVRETELEGVKLYTTITYSGVIATMIFEAKNNKDIDVEVELSLKGEIKEKSDSLPFKKLVRVGEKVKLGHVTSDSEVETGWKWTGLKAGEEPKEQVKEEIKKKEPEVVVQTSELKGVTLRQLLTAGGVSGPTTIRFEVQNSRDRDIKVEIDLTADAGGEVDFGHHSRPLTGVVHKKTSIPVHVGNVSIRGDAEVNWKFKELDD